MAAKVNILIVDDHPVFRRGLRNLLLKTNLASRIFEAGNGFEAIEVVKNEEVELVLMDIDMHGINGVDTTKHIIDFKPRIKIIAITMFCEPKFVYQICKNGAKGYLLKDAPIQEISKAINMVLCNEEYYSSKVQTILASVYRDNDKELPKLYSNIELTNAQKRVLVLLCQQKSTDEIALELTISVHTVNRHRHDLLERTNSDNLAGLVIYAIEHKLIEVNIIHGF